MVTILSRVFFLDDSSLNNIAWITLQLVLLFNIIARFLKAIQIDKGSWSQPKEKLVSYRKAKLKQKLQFLEGYHGETQEPTEVCPAGPRVSSVPSLSSQIRSCCPSAWHHHLFANPEHVHAQWLNHVRLRSHEFFANPERLWQHRGSRFHSSPQFLCDTRYAWLFGLPCKLWFVYLVQGFWRLVSE